MTQQKGKLPPLTKRAHTQGSPRIQPLHLAKENQYLKAREEAYRSKLRMIDLYGRYLLPRKDQKDRFKSQPRQFSYQLQRHKAKSNSKPVTSSVVEQEKTSHEKNQEAITTTKDKSVHQQQFTFNSLILPIAEHFYLGHLKGKKEHNHQVVSQFCCIIAQTNPFFSKISPAITEGLLKLGYITSFVPGQLIYKEKLISTIGFILWGQVLLKNKTTGLRLALPTGSSIGEQCLYQSESALKDESCWGQRCRAVSSCGVLMVGQKEVLWLCQQFISEGLKEGIQRFRSIMFRVYLRKKEFRNAS